MELVKRLNKIRKAHTDEWYTATGKINGIPYRVKGYNKFLQVFKVDHFDHGMSHEVSDEEEFEKYIATVFNFATVQRKRLMANILASGVM